MKSESKIRVPLPFFKRKKQKLSKWEPRGAAVQSSTNELSARGRAAVEDAIMAIEDTQILIADSKAFVAVLVARRLAVRVV